MRYREIARKLCITVDYSSFPKEQHAAIRGLVRHMEHMAPQWLHRLTITYGEKDDSFASVTHVYEQKAAYLWIHHTFFTLDDDFERLEVLAHEMGHLAIAPMSEFTGTCTMNGKPLSEDPVCVKFVEITAEDVGRCFLQLLNPPIE